ncbi:uncharacterized protein FIBRA_00669 [Fibroporia radiculosa]|uniref:AFG1-like ATPase n=1 Tax=Fibroporia radiculosa TaxID=599839 RepID=J4HRZ8_9APHY|nr:uncharacterized protein FIBRA_00669 [Fibroporia radiculosa]CCL98667.1 predicted protein [Fibroporia radiculosa]
MSQVQFSKSTPEGLPPPTWNRSVRHRWRELLNSGSLPVKWKRKGRRDYMSAYESVQPTIPFVVAQRLILQHWLIVFDEIQLLDVSSATLLADVLSWFWRMGGVIVGTSNKIPDDLYKNGVQTDRLEPFVEALKERCTVISIPSEHDWRAVHADAGTKKSWYVYGKEDEFEEEVRKCAGEATPRSMELSVFGRKLFVPWSSGGVCKFAFVELCDESLGSADYMTIASTYHTVAITAVPILRLSAKNQARRLISLIDALYEARCRVICLAESQLERLFFPDAPSEAEHSHNHDPSRPPDVDVMMAEAVAETQELYRPNVASYDAPNMSEAPKAPSSPLALDTLSIFSGKDEQFAYKRALSRLREMTSERYAADECWAPLPPSARKWEGTAQPAGPHNQPGINPHTQMQSLTWAPPPRSPDQPSGPFAHQGARTRESASDTTGLHTAGRPAAPRLSEDHIWGVRDDWGARSKDWGRGARAYERRRDHNAGRRGRE